MLCKRSVREKKKPRPCVNLLISMIINFSFFWFYINFGCCFIVNLHLSLTRCPMKNGLIQEGVLLLNPLTSKLWMLIRLVLLKCRILNRLWFCILHLLVFHCWFFSVQASNSGDADKSSNVMLPSCQDPLLAPTYKKLPTIPWVFFLICI